MRIIVASENPVKIAAVKQGFSKMFSDTVFEVRGVSVASGVADQPMSDAETLQGAYTRAQNAQRAIDDADYWVGLEGGIEEINNELSAFAWIVVIGSDGITGKGKTSTFFLPHNIAELVRSGEELGTAGDIVFGVTNSKHSTGTYGLLTDDVLTREDCYAEAVILALIPHTRKNLYSKA